MLQFAVVLQHIILNPKQSILDRQKLRCCVCLGFFSSFLNLFKQSLFTKFNVLDV